MDFNFENAPSFGRRESLIHAMTYLNKYHHYPVNIIETGTLRAKDRIFSDGWSTVAFGWYAQQTKSHLWTVDIDEEAINTSKIFTSIYSESITYVNTDSISFLNEFSKTIHFLYLDSLDSSKHDIDKMKISAEHQFKELEACYEKLHPKSLVLIDDTNKDFSWGKGLLSVPFLVNNGWKILYNNEHYPQVLLSRENMDIDK